ncbi:tryptophan-rich sensory protein [Microcoleus sp. FACHB-SPT15]|uniref:TspO/MBR family protein n=1 Tax=Microcoleus sp. FACHB-SPT15 TaxID=2692830 RepID=UPI001780AC6D|nr:TspO/MBR family protein [Microcoleus sp. FACHB-SPT15]MBD1806018.1 tryptophan-rich sensory protein [Microcoleus sp. FACHB-SPT15]
MKQSTKPLDRDIIRQVLNLIAILAAFGVNVLANVAPFNGLTIGEISNTFFRDVLITPANYAFAIWGLIYLGLISFGVYQILPAQRQNPHLRRMGYLLVVACLAQIAWVFFFQYRQFTLSLVAMLAILLPLIGVYLRVGIGHTRVSRNEKWFVHIPLSIYLAWISVATIVNVATTLYNLGWSGWGISAEVWTAIALIAGAAIASIVSIQRADIAFVLVIVWAFIAIAVRQANIPAIAITAGGLAVALVLLLLFSVLRRRKPSLNSNE